MSVGLSIRLLNKYYFVISPKHMLWLLKRTSYFAYTKHVKTYRLEITSIFASFISLLCNRQTCKCESMCIAFD